MSKTYENLPGAQGKSQFFRRQRFDAATLFFGMPPSLEFDGANLEIRNISGCGVGAAVRPPAADALLDVNRIGVLRLLQRGEEVYRGKARLARVESGGKDLVAGFALEGGGFDLDDLRRRNAVAAAKAAPASAPPAPAAYRAYCADVLDFANSYLANLARSVGRIESELTPELKAEIFRFVYDGVKRPWADMIVAGNELVIPHHDDRAMRAVLKRYTEHVVTSTFVEGPTWSRSYLKPLGYPGDYMLMNYMYDEKAEGDSLRAMFLHGLGLVAGRPIVS